MLKHAKKKVASRKPKRSRTSTLARLLKRKAKSITQLAADSGIPVSTLWSIEQRNRLPGQELILKLSNALSVSPNAILGWDKVASQEEVCHFYEVLQGYVIERMNKTVEVDITGNALITQEVIGLKCRTQTLINITHSVQAGPVTVGDSSFGMITPIEKVEGVAFEWIEGISAGKHRQTPFMAKDPANPSKGQLEIQLLPDQPRYSYRFRYRIAGAYKMSFEDTQGSASEGLEASSMYVARPVESLCMKVVFPGFYPPDQPDFQVWKGHSIYSPRIENVKSSCQAPGTLDIGAVADDPTRRCVTLNVLYPINGCSYGIVWRPIRQKDYIEVERAAHRTL